jgi:uncharacterized protein HemX
VENNNPTTSVATPPVTPVTPNPAPVAPEPTPTTTSGGSSKKVILLVVGLAVIAIAVAGFYFYSMNQTKQEEATKQTTMNELTELDSELNSVTVEEADKDLSAIDQDLQSL